MAVRAIGGGGRARSSPRQRPGRTFHYRAYGFAIVADTEMPELTPLRDLRRGPLELIAMRLRGSRQELPEPRRWLNISTYPDGTAWLRSARIDKGYLLRFPEMADFVIAKDGCEIHCVDARDGVSLVTLRHLALDHVLPRALNLRGVEALHATAIAAAAGVCAFLGEAGTGKSTLAASFQLAGIPVVCDDCMALADDGRVLAIPAYPGVRLWDDALKALASGGKRTLPVAQFTAKTRLIEDVHGFAGEPRPLIRIYFLRRAPAAERPAISLLKPIEAFPELVAASFPLDIGDRAMLARHFHLLGRVAASVPLRRLIVPDDFAALPAVRAAVLDDLAQN